MVTVAMVAAAKAAAAKAAVAKAAVAKAAIVMAAAAMASTASAHHGPTETRLAATRPCVDADAVMVTLTGRDGAPEAATERRLAELLQRDLAHLSASHGVVLRQAASCHGSDARVSLRIEARYLDPATYRNFAPETFSSVLTLRVVDETAATRAVAVSPLRYATASSALHSETESGMAVERYLADAGREAFTALAQAWWSDNPDGVLAPAPAARWRLLGVGFALFAGLGVAAAAWRRRQPAGLPR